MANLVQLHTIALLAVVTVACGGGADVVDAAANPLPDGGTGCLRAPAGIDRPRKVVIGHPFDTDGNKSNRFEVLDLDINGVLSQPGVGFEMGRAFDGEIAFTPDGKVGLVAQEDGSVGVFRFDDAGAVQVVHAGYDADGLDGFWASRVLVSTEGDHAYVLNSQWRNNGGGIFQLAIACDGTLTMDGKLAESKLPYAMSIMPDGQRGLVGAVDILDSKPTDTAHLIDFSNNEAVISGADAFGDTDVIIASSDLTESGKYFLLGDNSTFHDDPMLPTRVAVLEVQSGGGLRPVQVIAPIEDPIDIVTSPYDDGALVISGFGDAIFELDFDANAAEAAEPFSLAGELTYSGAGPQLPSAAVMIERGVLRGLVLVAEVTGIRRVRFAGGGNIVDDGATSVGTGNESIVGAIGVQP